MKIDIMYDDPVQLISEDKGEDFASASLNNPNVRWMKFILTDDLPNGNRQRIPIEEFDNLIRSGEHMPLKVSAGEISPGHPNTFPIGVITNLVKEENRVKGLAALWERERPSDVKMILDKHAAKEPLNISWEVYYGDSTQADGVEELRNVSLAAATLVGRPAYTGRTPVLVVASQEEKEENNLEELDTLTQAKAELEQKVADLTKSLDELNVKISELETEKVALSSTVEATASELDELRKFKSEVEKREADEAKFAGIKAKFGEAGLKLDEAYFTERREHFLSMDEKALDFFVQELVAFGTKTSSASIKSNVPNIPIVNTSAKSPSEIARLLREHKEK